MRKSLIIFIILLVTALIVIAFQKKPVDPQQTENQTPAVEMIDENSAKNSAENLAEKPQSSEPQIATDTDTQTDAQLLTKIDQLFILGFRGYDFAKAPDIKRALAETNLGGVILFDYDTPTKKYTRNIKSDAQVKKLINDLQTNAKTPLFISVDEEGGKVSRLKNLAGFQKTSSAAYLGTQNTATVRTVGKNLGTQLTSYGFNMDFAPVLDVNVNPKNPVIGGIDRSFSASTATVSEKGIAFMNGLLESARETGSGSSTGRGASSGMVPVGKHFPGHGSSTADSHLGFVDITDTYKEYELEPFKAACAAGLPAIMVAHVYNKNVDPTYPATLSKNHMQVLKKDIGCVSQLVISDDMDMRAISSQYGRKEAVIRSLNAGVDVLIISNNVTGYDAEVFFKARKIVLEAVKSGEISKERLQEAYEKVKAFKLKYIVKSSAIIPI